MRNNNLAQKKKIFIESIKTNYTFLIWKLSLYKIYCVFSFCFYSFYKRRNRIRKNLKQIGDSAQNSYIILAFFTLIVGTTQIFTQHTGISFFDLATDNLPIFRINVHKNNWKTFHIRELPYILKANPVFFRYKKIDLSNKVIFIKPTLYYQNQYYQSYFGFIDLKNKLNQKFLFINNFSKNRFFISVQTNNLKQWDTIPNKLESGFKKTKRQNLLILLQEDKFDRINFKIDRKLILKDQVSKKQPIKKVSQNLLLKKNLKLQRTKVLKRKEVLKFQRTKNLKRKEFLKFLNKQRFKKIISQHYRNIFYKEGYNYLNPKNILIRRTQKYFSIIRRLRKHELSYLDVLKITQDYEIGFFNSHLQPRLCSGYRFPDEESKIIRSFFYDNIRPLIIKIDLYGKYRSFFFKSFAQSLKRQRKFISDKINNRYEKKQIDKEYQSIKLPLLQTPKNNYYRKQTTVYKKINFIPPLNLWKLNRLYEIYFQASPKTLFFKNTQFYEVRESIKSYSWLIITQIGVAMLGFKLLQKLYQEYGKEIVLSLVNFISLIGVLPDGEWLKEELNLDNYDKGFRAVRKVRKYFHHAAGITHLMIHLDSILWYLRTKQIKLSRFFYFLNPKAQKNRSFIIKPILLIGPPGTGKTLLVQALAGETGVPVLLQSGGVLKDFRQRGKGARAIRNLFRRARQIIPCIIFIDEVDGMGVRRESLSLDPMEGKDTIEALKEVESNPNPVSFDDLKNFTPKTQVKDLLDDEEIIDFDKDISVGETLPEPGQKGFIRIKVLQESQVEQNLRTEQLTMLTQLLIELDGLISLNNIMVLGATNRPHILDPALLRPGRFYRILKLSLPNQKKRIEILKLYTSHMGPKIKLPWYYLSQRMEGLSAADIAAIVNESALLSICNDKKHTVQSLEKGFDRITTYSLAKNLDTYNKKLLRVNFEIRHRWFCNPFFANSYKVSKKLIDYSPNFFKLPQTNEFLYSTQFKNLAYYQSGKCLVQILLPQHPSSVYFSIQEREKNFRYRSAHGLVLSLMDQMKFRVELEERLVGLLAGKASEFLSGYASICSHLKEFTLNTKFNISSVGEEDLQSATLLSFLMIEKWYFYAEKICTQIYHPIPKDFNFDELYPEDVKLFQAIFEDLDTEIDTQNRLAAKTQKWSYRTWWMRQIFDEESFFEQIAMEWYRIFLPEPEEGERNIEWVPPDDYYTSLNIRMTSSLVYWHYFLKLIYDYLYHSLLLNCFNKAFCVLNQNCELIDYLVDFVLRHEKARNNQIRVLITPFLNNETLLPKKHFGRKDFDEQDFIILKDWGSLSRRRYARFLRLDDTKENEDNNKAEKEFSSFFQKLKLPGFLLKYPIN